MLTKVLGAAAGLALVAGAGEAAAQTLIIRDAAVRVVVTPEARNTITATMSGGGGRLARPTVRDEGGNLVVDGGLAGRIRGCGAFVMFGSIRSDWNDPVRPDRRGRVRIEGIGNVPLTQLPFLDIRVPLDTRIEAGGAVFGAIGRSRSVTLTTAGCGDWSVANTEGRLTVSQSGSGDVRAGTTAGVTSTIRGSGDLEVTDVNGPLTAEVAGSGDVDVMRVNGPVRVQVRGSGDVHIADGVARGLEAETRGSGDMSIAAADGPVRLSMHGSGDIDVHRGRATNVIVELRGSGDVTYDGEAATATVDMSGSGDVSLGRVAGQVNRTARGSGDLSVNGRTLTDR